MIMKKLRKHKNHSKFENFTGIWFFNCCNYSNERAGHIYVQYTFVVYSFFFELYAFLKNLGIPKTYVFYTVKDHSFMMSTRKRVEGGIMKFFTWLRFLLLLNNRSIAHFCGYHKCMTPNSLICSGSLRNIWQGKVEKASLYFRCVRNISSTVK